MREDIGFQAAEWRIPNPKGGLPQVKPLPQVTLEILKALPRNSPFILPGRDLSRSRQDIKNHWNTLRRAARIPGVSIHDVRRTFGRDITQQAGLLMASRLLGHSDVRVTERHYSPMDITQMREAVEERTQKKVVPIGRRR
ncbi:MAG: tyrosine-type recombinase/integrase [Acidobacteriota bacterium]